MRRISLLCLLIVAALTLGASRSVFAQEGLTLTTTYPSLVIGIGEGVTIPLEIHSPISQVVTLAVTAPQGWTASFRGSGQTVKAVYVQADEAGKVDLRVETPDEVNPGDYQVIVQTSGANGEKAELRLAFQVEGRTPASLSFQADFPTLRGGADTTFRYTLTLRNDGDEDVTVNLTADAPAQFLVNFQSGGKDVTVLPVEAGRSKTINLNLEPIANLEVGTYPVTVYAQSGDVEARIELTAEVVGRSSLSITTPDGRLSGDAYIGRDNLIKLQISNTGSAPAKGIELSASSPTGWEVTLDPQEIAEISANSSVEVTANVKPSDKAVAGDYLITFTARPKESAAESAQFRVTVRTSTLWGLVGVVLIAVAVGVVGMAVMRFGRR